MNIGGSVLNQLCKAFHYPVEQERVILFAVRGSLPEDTPGNCSARALPFRTSHTLKQVRINYQTPRCTIGIWDKHADKIALFPGSTLPSRDYVRRYPSSLSTLNVLCPGCYQFRKGIHPRNEKGYQRHEALLMDEWAIVAIPRVTPLKSSVTFSSRVTQYVVMRAGDNLHAGRMEPTGNANPSLLSMKYSSSGCITIAGQPSQYLRHVHDNTDWNPWVSFIESDILTTHNNYPFILFKYDDLCTSAGATRSIRYGSKHDEVSDIQQLLSTTLNANTGCFYYSGDPDCSFSGDTAVSYFSFHNDYFSSTPNWEIRPQIFFQRTQHFRSKTKTIQPPLTPSQHVIHRSSANN